LALSYAAPIVSLLGSFLSSFTETEKEMVSVERTLQVWIRDLFPLIETCFDIYTLTPNIRLMFFSTWTFLKKNKPEAYTWIQIGQIKDLSNLIVLLWNICHLCQLHSAILVLELLEEPKSVNYFWICIEVFLGSHPLGLILITQHVIQVGIIGRTGAGKSSVLNALFRLTPICTGSISIDGVDIKNISVRELRTHLAIVPQSPFLFEGSLRYFIWTFLLNTSEANSDLAPSQW